MGDLAKNRQIRYNKMMKRERKIIQTSLIGIATNVVLVGFKMAVGLISGSLAIVLDAVNNLTDVLSSVITIVGTKLANRRPDKEHPYGHGRYEYLSALMIGAIILTAGIMALVESVPKIFHPELADYSVASIIVISGAVLAKLILGRYVKRMGQKLDCGSLVASGVDALWDAVLSFSTLIGIFTAMWFQISIDGYLGVLIGIFILRSSIEILSEALGNILGTAVNPELAREIKQVIRDFPEVKGVYDLRLHNYGPNSLIGSVHIEVADSLTAKEIHRLTREIAHRIFTDFEVMLTVAVYAENASTKEHQAIRSELDRVIKEIAAVSNTHGFYVDDESKIIFFDLEVPIRYYHNSEVKEQVISKMQATYPDYQFLVTLDIDMEE